MSNEQSLATVRAVYDAFNIGDMPTLLGLVAEDFELVDVALGMTWRGPQGGGGGYRTATSMPDARIRLDSILAEGDIVW